MPVQPEPIDHHSRSQRSMHTSFRVFRVRKRFVQLLFDNVQGLPGRFVSNLVPTMGVRLTVHLKSFARLANLESRSQTSGCEPPFRTGGFCETSKSAGL